MDTIVLVVFVIVYLGMILGRLPGLALDRTGVALVGAIAIIATERMTAQEAWEAIDVPTTALLLGLMVVSAQFRLGGFYTQVTMRIAGAEVGPRALLGMLMVAAGALSAVLANDIVCLAMAPVLVEGCAKRRLNPVPFLLGLACSANVGSAATLIGNPQNMLIGQSLSMSFTGYLADAVAPAAVGMAVTWWIICWRYRGKWEGGGAIAMADSTPVPPAPRIDWYQTGKGLVVLAGLMSAFLFAPWPREIVALGAAGVVLLSRRMHSREMLALVDWQLLVLFIGLFIVNGALAQSGMLGSAVGAMREAGVDPGRPATLFVLTAVLSNVVSNVPAVMLLLPTSDHPSAGAVLALSSTLAGNLFVVGSIANIIVMDAGGRMGVRISWKEHARTGVPVTAATLAIAGLWLWGRAMMGAGAGG